jgi:CheY-like chemotaxis protein
MMTSPGRILIVEDEAIPRRMIQFALSERGFVCDVAEDGQQALAYLANQHYDVVVTDLMMPNVNGGDLVIKLRNQLCPPAILVYTSIQRTEVTEGLKREGVNEILFKPTPCSRVAETIQKLMHEQSCCALNGWGRQIHQASSWIVANNAARSFQRVDAWIQCCAHRSEVFRFAIVILACLLLGMGWGTSLTSELAGVCAMFGKCGLAFFFCLELVAYYRDRWRASLVRRGVERRLVDQQPLLSEA